MPKIQKRISDNAATGATDGGQAFIYDIDSSQEAPGFEYRGMQTGRNFIAAESSLPQLGQLRWGSVFMGLIGPWDA